MTDYQVWDSDDFGSNHIISDMCQSRDCRGELLKLKEANPAFKITLFAIPGEMTAELLDWSFVNNEWIELAYHGIFHISNYECEKMSYEEFNNHILGIQKIMGRYLVHGFKAPGWQISDDIYQWLLDNGWWVADQAYNDNRRPKELPVYKVNENSVHTHTWSCMGNGIDETLPQLLERVKQTDDFRFVSEVVG